VIRPNTAIIPIEGIITTEVVPVQYLRGGVMSSDIVKSIDKIAKKVHIKAIIFEINSPGGTPFAVKEVTDRIHQLDKKTVAWIREYGTSGAYWIASACDKIVADKLSNVGSIGVAMLNLNFSELMERYGISDESIILGKFKGIGLPFRRPSSEERELLEEKVRMVYDHFVEEVVKNRKLERQTIEEISGAPLLGEEGLNVGLVDYLGGKEKALEVSRELANITRSKVKEIRQGGLFPFSILRRG
jgi:protease-4